MKTFNSNSLSPKAISTIGNSKAIIDIRQLRIRSCEKAVLNSQFPLWPLPWMRWAQLEWTDALAWVAILRGEMIKGFCRWDLKMWPLAAITGDSINGFFLRKCVAFFSRTKKNTCNNKVTVGPRWPQGRGPLSFDFFLWSVLTQGSNKMPGFLETMFEIIWKEGGWTL